MWRHHNMCWKWPPFASRQDWTRLAMFWESPCQYVRCHCLNFFGDVCSQGAYGSWFCFGKQNKTTNKTKQTLNQMTERSAERRVRQETGWLPGGPHFRIATNRRTTDTHYRHTLQTRTTDTHYIHIPLHLSHNERTPLQISLQYLH